MIDAMERRRPSSPGIVLPVPVVRNSDRAIDRSVLDDAIEAGRSLGFVCRDPITPDPSLQRRSPGPRRREPQDRLSVSGPRRVTQAFRAYCTRLGVTHWEGLARLMDAARTGEPERPDRSVPTGIRPVGPRHPDPAIAGADAPNPEPRHRESSPTLIEATVQLPSAMLDWVHDRMRAARYVDAGDYVRALIRRDQDDAVAIHSREGTLSAIRSARAGRN